MAVYFHSAHNAGGGRRGGGEKKKTGATKSDVGQTLCEFKYRCADRNHIGGRILIMETYIINYLSKYFKQSSTIPHFLTLIYEISSKNGKEYWINIIYLLND
jgi:hypothetical protein